MKLKDRLRQSLAKRPGHVVLRREWAHFGSPSQLSHALLTLQEDGLLDRIGEGIYAKPPPRYGVPSTTWVLNVVREAYGKFGVTVTDGVVQNNEIFVHVAKAPRRDRFMRIAGRPVRVMRPAPDEAPTLPDDVRALPTANVKQYVRQLAAAHRVTFRRTRIDDWAEAVTRAAGDDVQIDDTGGLLIRLKQRNVLNPAQFTRLLINHRRELARV